MSNNLDDIFDKPAGNNAFYLRAELEPKIKALIESVNDLYMQELGKVTITTDAAAAWIVGENIRAVRRATLRAKGEL